MLSVALNNGVKPSTKPTLPIDWLGFALLAIQTYNLSSKLPTQTHQLHYLASRTSPYGTITQYKKNSSFIETEQRYLCRVLTATAKIEC